MSISRVRVFGQWRFLTRTPRGQLSSSHQRIESLIMSKHLSIVSTSHFFSSFLWIKSLWFKTTIHSLNSIAKFSEHWPLLDTELRDFHGALIDFVESGDMIILQWVQHPGLQMTAVLVVTSGWFCFIFFTYLPLKRSWSCSNNPVILLWFSHIWLFQASQGWNFLSFGVMWPWAVGRLIHILWTKHLR